MILKHCIIRVNNSEYIVSSLKGEFMWIGAESARNRNYKNY